MVNMISQMTIIVGFKAEFNTVNSLGRIIEIVY